jgi:hypothetical protein
MAITLEQAKKELAEIEVKLKDFSQLMQRKQMLEQFLSLGERLSPSSKSAVTEAHTLSIAPPETTIAARDVLRKFGQLHLRELVLKMRQLGWAGSPDQKTAEKTVYVNMHRNKGLFENVGNNIWRIRVQETKAAS